MKEGHSREAYEFWQDAFAHLAQSEPKSAARFTALSETCAEYAKTAPLMYGGLAIPRPWRA